MSEKQNEKEKYPSQFDKVKELTEQLETGIKALFEDPESSLRQWLTVCGKFHNYSLNNTLLIAMQLPPGAQGPIAGMTTWNKLGRKVNKGSKAIKILAPAPFKRKMEVDRVDPVTGNVMRNPDGSAMKETKEIMQPAFKVVNTFDYSQTWGKELPDPGVNELIGTVDQYEMFFEALKRSSPVPIAFEQIEGGAKGYYHLKDNRIAIQEGMSEAQTIKTCIHEIAHSINDSMLEKMNVKPEIKEPTGNEHSLQQAEANPLRSRAEMESTAEAVAFCVANFFNLDTSSYSMPYIGTFASGKELPELKASLDLIRTTADKLITAIEQNLQDIRKERGLEQVNDKASVLSELHSRREQSGEKKEKQNHRKRQSEQKPGRPGRKHYDHRNNICSSV